MVRANVVDSFVIVLGSVNEFRETLVSAGSHNTDYLMIYRLLRLRRSNSVQFHLIFVLFSDLSSPFHVEARYLATHSSRVVMS